MNSKVYRTVSSSCVALPVGLVHPHDMIKVIQTVEFFTHLVIHTQKNHIIFIGQEPDSVMMYHMFGKYQGDKKFVENVGRCADIVVRATHIMASRYDDNLKKKHNII